MHKPAALAILALAFALRLFGLGSDSIWYDEGVSLYLARLSLPDLIAHTAGDIHPPLYYAALHVWLQLAGESQVAAAFFSLFFSMLLLTLAAALARRLFGEDAALLTGFLIAVSPYNLWYAQEVRMYTLGAFLGLLSFWLLWRVWLRPPSALPVGADAPNAPTAGARPTQQRTAAVALAYVITAALGLYTLYYFVFLLVFQNLVVLALWLRRRVPLRLWLAAQLGVAALYLPWLPTALRQATQPPVPPWRGAVDAATVAIDSWAALALGQSVDPRQVAPVLLLFAVVALAALSRRRQAHAFLLFAYTSVPVLLIYLASFITPLFHVRYVFVFAPAFYIVLARGLQCIGRRSAALSALALAVITLACLRSAQAYFYDPAYAPDDHRSAVRYIAERARPGDALLISAGYAYPTFVYYYPDQIAWRGRLADYAQQPPPQAAGLVVVQTGSLDGSANLGWGRPTSDFYATTEAETIAALAETARRHERLWVLRIYDTVTDPQGFIRRYLADNFLPLEDEGFAGASSMRVQLYRTYRAPRLEPPRFQQTLNANFGAQARLLGFDAPANPLRAGDPADLAIYWQAASARPALRVFVALVDEAGREWAHWDDLPGGSLYPTSRWAENEVVRQPWRLAPPLATPAGAYWLEAGVYDAASGKRLDVLDPSGRALGASVRLSRIEVAPTLAATIFTALQLQTTVQASLGDEVRLVGYDVGSRLAQPGEQVNVSVVWQGIRPAADARVVFLQLLDRTGKLWAAWEGAPVAAWGAGGLLRDHYALRVPADAPDGEMRLIMGVYRAGDAQRLTVSGGRGGVVGGLLERILGRGRDTVDLGLLRVAARERHFEAPATQHTVSAQIGAGAALLGYNRTPTAQPLTLQRGERLHLALVWQATGMMDTSYTVFVQLLGPDNRLGGQYDGAPGGGLYPTTGWLPGEVISDRVAVTVRADAAPGEYQLVAGLYDARSGLRVPASLGGIRQRADMIVLEAISIR